MVYYPTPVLGAAPGAGTVRALPRPRTTLPVPPPLPLPVPVPLLAATGVAVVDARTAAAAASRAALAAVAAVRTSTMLGHVIVGGSIAAVGCTLRPALSTMASSPPPIL
jgi:hypothetical protein